MSADESVGLAWGMNTENSWLSGSACSCASPDVILPSTVISMALLRSSICGRQTRTRELNRVS
eukprot:359014-Chlamydomonas_euryale.AAC.7